MSRISHLSLSSAMVSWPADKDNDFDRTRVESVGSPEISDPKVGVGVSASALLLGLKILLTRSATIIYSWCLRDPYVASSILSRTDPIKHESSHSSSCPAYSKVKISLSLSGRACKNQEA